MYNENFTEDEYRQGEQYRASWYSSRNLELIYPWRIISEQAKVKWTKEALGK